MEENSKDINDKLNKIIELLNKNKFEGYNEENGSVIFKFDYNNKIVPVISSINKLMSALYDLQQYRREIYKYGTNDEIYVDQKTKIAYNEEELIQNRSEENKIEKTRKYIESESVINKIDEILEQVNDIIENYWY